ncbi:MAG: hypothetical protein ACLFPE_08460 [Bacteroidales bacterium]
MHKQYIYPQDLHIHTIYSRNDSAVVPEQTLELIYNLGHARITGISDHIEAMDLEEINGEYIPKVRSFGFKAGVEVDGFRSVEKALKAEVDYYVYHCRDKDIDYYGAELLLETSKPLIIAHPYAIGTNLERVPGGCYVEINNRYVWRYNWRRELSPFTDRFRFVISSDAHQPNWLNQHVARHVAGELGIEETILF